MWPMEKLAPCQLSAVYHKKYNYPQRLLGILGNQVQMTFCLEDLP